MIHVAQLFMSADAERCYDPRRDSCRFLDKLTPDKQRDFRTDAGNMARRISDAMQLYVALSLAFIKLAGEQGISHAELGQKLASELGIG